MDVLFVVAGVLVVLALARLRGQRRRAAAALRAEAIVRERAARAEAEEAAALRAELARLLDASARMAQTVSALEGDLARLRAIRAEEMRAA